MLPSQLCIGEVMPQSMTPDIAPSHIPKLNVSGRARRTRLVPSSNVMWSLLQLGVGMPGAPPLYSPRFAVDAVEGASDTRNNKGNSHSERNTADGAGAQRLRVTCVGGRVSCRCG